MKSWSPPPAIITGWCSALVGYSDLRTANPSAQTSKSRLLLLRGSLLLSRILFKEQIHLLPDWLIKDLPD